MLKLPDFIPFPKDAKVRFLDVPEIPQFNIRPDPEVASRLGLGTDAHFDYIKRNACEAWESLADLHVKVLNCETVPVRGRHSHSENETDAEQRAHCMGCIIEKKQAEGRPVVRVQVMALRDVQPVELVETPVVPQQHKKKRWMSETYHRRTQKKWNKKVAGLTELRPKQETVMISMSQAAFKAISNKFAGQY
jgi:hypothetical protein